MNKKISINKQQSIWCSIIIYKQQAHCVKKKWIICKCALPNHFTTFAGEKLEIFGSGNLNLEYSTVRYIIKRYEETGLTKNQPRSGRPTVLTQRERRQILIEVSRNAFTRAQTMANSIAVLRIEQIYGRYPRNILTSQ